MDVMAQTLRRPLSWAPRARYQLLGTVLALVLVLNLIDLTATITWIQLGLAEEVNPFMDYLLQIHPLLFALVKIVLVSTAVMILWRFRDHGATHVASGLALTLYMGTYVMHAYGAVIVTS